MYVERNIEVCSRNHFMNGKVISIAYFECMTLDLYIHSNEIHNVVALIVY